MTEMIGSPSRAEGTPLEVSDEELMARTRLGERAAFACLVERHQDGLVAYLSRLTGSRDRGEDLGQETFLRAYRFAARYREEGHFKAYLFRIATNLARSEARSERRRRLFLPFFRWVDAVEPLASREMLRDEADAQVAQAIASLPMRLREPVVLHEIEDWPYTEIARALRSFADFDQWMDDQLEHLVARWIHAAAPNADRFWRIQRKLRRRRVAE